MDTYLPKTVFCPLLASIALLAAGCAVQEDREAARGLILATADLQELTLPAGVHRAVIFEIDGVRVATGRRSVQVSPGIHTVRAAPVVPGPTHQVPSAEALATRLKNLTVTVDVTAGSRHLIGIRWIEPFQYQSGSGVYEAVAFAPGALASGVRHQDPP